VTKYLPVNPERANIEYRIGNVLKDKRLLKADLILLDTFHDGIFERQFMEHLKKHDWHGTIIFDDINLNDAMRDFWKELGGADFTFVGHYTGTGILKL
jgi:hypothetical protein